MTTNTGNHLTNLTDTLAEHPEAVLQVVCAPAQQSELSGAEAIEVAELLGIDFALAPFSVEELQTGIEVELTLGQEGTPSLVDALDDDLVEIGKIVVANLDERSDYYRELTQAHAPGDTPATHHRPADVGSD